MASRILEDTVLDIMYTLDTETDGRCTFNVGGWKRMSAQLYVCSDLTIFSQYAETKFTWEYMLCCRWK